jgi:hypothetical protein
MANLLPLTGLTQSEILTLDTVAINAVAGRRPALEPTTTQAAS